MAQVLYTVSGLNDSLTLLAIVGPFIGLALMAGILTTLLLGVAR